MSSEDHDSEPVLYILMRDDMSSLTPGKMASQACHAANQCIYDHPSSIYQDILDWEGDRAFGTTIVLASSGPTIVDVIRLLREDGFHANTTVDPTYPLRDGRAMLKVSVMTCAYVFGHRQALRPYLKDFLLAQ